MNSHVAVELFRRNGVKAQVNTLAYKLLSEACAELDRELRLAQACLHLAYKYAYTHVVSEACAAMLQRKIEHYNLLVDGLTNKLAWQSGYKSCKPQHVSKRKFHTVHQSIVHIARENHTLASYYRLTLQDIAPNSIDLCKYGAVVYRFESFVYVDLPSFVSFVQDTYNAQIRYNGQTLLFCVHNVWFTLEVSLLCVDNTYSSYVKVTWML